MNKALILTCGTGEGHNSAAYAIEAALKKQNWETEVRDPITFQSRKMSSLVCSLYNDTICKAPALFGAVYKIGDAYCSLKLPSPVYWANSRYAGLLKAYILEQEFDLVICTHLYGMEAMTAIRKDPAFQIPCYGVLTDYVCIPFIEETDLTGFFVPTHAAAEHLIARGIPAEKIVLSGIPVHAKFTRLPTRQQARQELQIGEDRKVYLIMTGGVGCENMEDLCTEFFRQSGPGDLALVLTGKNEELRKRLELRFPDRNRLRAVGFTDRVPSYMAAADVMLSKPGGLSSTEAAVAGVPLVHIHAIPGCETFNARFFAERGMAAYAENDREAVRYARILVEHPEYGEQMRKTQRRNVNPRAAEMIAEEASRLWITAT